MPETAQSMEPDRRERLAQAALVVSAVCVVCAFLACEVYSLDVWWQIVIGTDILDGGGIPNVDRHSGAGSGRPYHDSHWLFQVVLALFHRAGGMVGVQVFVAAAWLTILGLVFAQCRRFVTMPVAVALSLVAAMASIERFLPRPELATFAGVACFGLLLAGGDSPGWRRVTLLAFVQVLWTNAHGLFVIGPAIVACHLASALLDRQRRATEVRRLGWLLACVTGATLLTPQGLETWRYAALLFTEVGPWAPTVLGSLGELSSTFGSAARSGLAFWFFLGLLALAAGTAAASLRRASCLPGSVLVALMMLVAALTGRRNIVLFALTAAPMVSELLAMRGLGSWLPGRRTSLVLTGTCFLLLLLPLSGRYYTWMEIPARVGWGATPSFFPHELPAFLDEIDFEGPVLNSNVLGGFYTYHRWPSDRALTDGRWEVQDHHELQRILAVGARGTDWQELLRHYGIRGVLLAHASQESDRMTPLLLASGEWRLVYLDRAATFWLPESRADVPASVDLSTVESLPKMLRVDDALMLSRFFKAAGADRLLVSALERGLAGPASRERSLEQLGHAQIRLHRWVDAEASFRALLELRPDHAAALNELAFLAYTRGDVPMARDLMNRALALDPGNDKYRSNAQRLETEATQNRTKDTPQ